jgi:nucleoside-diphosphate-sugar epimerase
MSRRNVSLETMVRVIADATLLNVALLIGVLVRVGLIHDGTKFATPSTFFRGSLFLSIIGPSVFALWGFYSKKRAYESKYKAVLIAQACGLVFLLFTVLNYMLMGNGISRLVVLVAWLAATILVTGARLWAWVWLQVLEREQKVPYASPAADENKVLLIGGAGYIGSGLLPRLLEHGYKVRLLDAFIYGDEAIADCLTHPNLEIVRADFRNVHDVVYAMRGVGSVIHLGAIVGDPACALDEELTIEVNLLATRTIAEVAKAKDVRKFIFASTCSVYGANDQILNEYSALNPVSLYARSKIACEHVLIKMRTEKFLPVILRFGTIYGLSGRTRFDLVVNLLTAKAVAEGRITVFGKEQWRPFLHVHDAGRAVLAALEAGHRQLSDVIFNVGSDAQNYTLGRVGEIINSMVPSADLVCTETDADRRNYRVDFSRIRKALNFTPEYTIENGIQQVLDAIYSEQVLDYRDAKYSNAKFLGDEHAREMLTVDRDWAKTLLQTVPQVVIEGTGA